jgi:hypothetical protein
MFVFIFLLEYSVVVVLCSHIVLVSVYHGKLLFLHQFWMIGLLGRVSKDWNFFLSGLKIPHSMPLLNLRFLLRNLLLFWWIYLYMLFDFLSYRLQYSFLVLCASCFNDNLLWRGSILIMFVRCPGGFLYLSGHLFIKIWEIFCYYFVEIMACTSSPSTILIDLQVWSFNGTPEFLHILFAAHEPFV